MANIKISDLTALEAQPSTDDYFVIVDTSEAADADKTKKIDFGYAVKTYADSITAALAARAYFVPLTTPLTSTSWDGDSFSTTAKTKIDLSDVFGAPAGIKAILAYIYVRDSGSATDNGIYFGLSPNDTDHQVALACASRGLPNDYVSFAQGIVPCDANGDVYYQCIATGSNTLDVWLQIWGYWL